MRVLSIQQPFAQLVVRGVKRIEVRSWDPRIKERVAIHASTKVASKDDATAWLSDLDTARCFADQGWIERADFMALSHGAIVGTAQLAGVYLGRDVHAGKTELFAWTNDAGVMEVSERDPHGGGLHLTKRRTPLLLVPLAENAYAWHFTDAIEFKPITDVDGKQRLWRLEGELEGVIADRERFARKGVWRPTAANASRRDKAMRKLRERENAAREALLEAVERRIAQKRELAAIRLTPAAEMQFSNDIARYSKVNRIGSPSASDPQLRVEPRLLKRFGGREVVGTEEFTLVIKRSIKQQADAQLEARRRTQRRERMLAAIDAANQRGESGGVTRQKLRWQLEAALDRMLEEAEEDIEFLRRELHPLSDEKAARAEERARANEAQWMADGAKEAKRLEAIERKRRAEREAFEELMELAPVELAAVLMRELPGGLAAQGRAEQRRIWKRLRE